ncbi:MAG: hypothetical protein ACK4JB_19090 [Reyranella sp.]
MPLDEIEQLLRMASYVATPIVAIAAVSIAWRQARIATQQAVIARQQAETARQQAKVNERKVEADLYDRRLKIYEEVRRVLGVAMRKGDVPVEDFLQFSAGIADADFLFGDDVVEYLKALRERCNNLGLWNDLLRVPPESRGPDHDHQKIVKDKYDTARWIVAQHEPAKQLFKKYMHLAAR